MGELERDISCTEERNPPWQLVEFEESSAREQVLLSRNAEVSRFGSGGGIFNEGTLIISNSIISENTAGYGGGIYNGGALTVNNSTITQNIAQEAGGGI